MNILLYSFTICVLTWSSYYSKLDSIQYVASFLKVFSEILETKKAIKNYVIQVATTYLTTCNITTRGKPSAMPPTRMPFSSPCPESALYHSHAFFILHL